MLVGLVVKKVEGLVINLEIVSFSCFISEIANRLQVGVEGSRGLAVRRQYAGHRSAVLAEHPEPEPFRRAHGDVGGHFPPFIVAAEAGALVEVVLREAVVEREFFVGVTGWYQEKSGFHVSSPFLFVSVYIFIFDFVGGLPCSSSLRVIL